MKKLVTRALITVILACGQLPATLPIPTAPVMTPLATIKAADCRHSTGREGSVGWEADRRTHRPGLLAEGPPKPLLLSAGAYRATIRIRRGMYPKKGLLSNAEQILRFEVRDAASGATLGSRIIDVSELPTSNHYENRWVEFTLPPGQDRLAFASAFWLGGVNAEVESFSFYRITTGTPAQFEARANHLSERVRRDQIENGFVVSRKKSGEPDETGDATTYTAFYAAALAWHLSTRRDDATTQDFENALMALHSAIKGDAEHPILARYADADGSPHPASPSKDVYTAFFFGCAMAYPQIENHALKAQVKEDVRRVATRLLKDGLVVRGGKTVLASFAPYFTTEELHAGIRSLVAEKDHGRTVARMMHKASSYSPFQPLVPGIKEISRALEKRDENALFKLALPAADGVLDLADRVAHILREHGRRDLIGPALNRAEPAALRLAALLTSSLKKLPSPTGGRRLHTLSDLRVLPSNALIALHIIKTAAVITGDAQFEEYYRNNLYGQDALLQTALDWYGVDDEFLRDTGGNAAAARERRGYLAMMAAYNLYQLEKNPAIRETYKTIIRREAASEAHDDNPLITAIAASVGLEPDMTPLSKALSLYPDSPDGLGDTFWGNNGLLIANDLGGGENKGYAMEPLPVSHRPRDSFLWQRNTRRIVGDLENSYPGADYVFLYWLARKNGLVSEPPSTPPTVLNR